VTRNVNTDLVAGIIGLVVAGVFWSSIDPDVGRLSIMFPRAMVVILALVAAALVVKGFVNAQRNDLFVDGNNLRWIVTGVIFFLWILATIYIGFWVSSVVGLTVMVYYLSRARITPTPRMVAGWLVIVMAEVTFFYLIFTKLLLVPLPQGWLF
jgi:hypothetical protein